ncbi:hypothetical protein PTSG_02327 [Salpingoeca rosetta]|uniref:Transcription factor CBF/NF-Y/archaeal histone domain-containing protein n=1 Tax=Salpingoeca rosetta (strain ATCC 50818 / BSB-021) TaxID=946362 RepID=F2U1V9_SALR5|nr:uncharacterized protein PTSG_02327 [Salpingoeca rosetta]EGD81611.1 hypothetical protein PTSG_02327 [Salpingoeca rosetta]|eukprot:XP_004996815.1 hypothetical protein PTSG_02327 [Salpingoeca rosetta]
MPRGGPKPRFPASRIKKIMQTDEDVGKVSTGTPVVISAVLEAFITDLLDQTTTTHPDSKTIGASHLKEAVDANPKFDFLKDVLSNQSGVDNQQDT